MPSFIHPSTNSGCQLTTLRGSFLLTQKLVLNWMVEKDSRGFLKQKTLEVEIVFAPLLLFNSPTAIFKIFVYLLVFKLCDIGRLLS